ncbi:MAG: sulfurtransferase [Gammaproteobacteria bacterium]|nr:sulfurtransferase [Gammaproteobacteria bacterium]
MFKTLISPEQLSALSADERIVVDCRYDLQHPESGRQSYLQGHIPGAVFADVHDDLSGPPLTDKGRHPLPSPAALTKTFSQLGIAAGKQVVVYDDSGGAFAARLWWLLRYMDHECVALLDGGWSAWTDSELPVRDGEERNSPANFAGTPRSDWLVLLEQVPGVKLLVDSRDPARYRGETEPIDPAAGHIPGALNRFWQANLDPSGCFKSPAELRQEFQALYSDAGSDQPVFYCGSGVTACHNLLAVMHAGLEPARLYAGSWSEWCSDPERPVETG